MSLASVARKARSGLSSFSSSTGGKAALTGAGIGGGSFLALSGAAAGAEKMTDATGLSGIVKLINPEADEEGSRGVGSIIGIGLLVGLALLVVFVILPKVKKGGSKHV